MGRLRWVVVMALRAGKPRVCHVAYMFARDAAPVGRERIEGVQVAGGMTRRAVRGEGPGFRSVPAEGVRRMTGNRCALPAPGARVIGPGSGRTYDVEPDNADIGIAGVQDSVGMGRRAGVVIVAPLAVDGPRADMFFMPSGRRCAARYQGIKVRGKAGGVAGGAGGERPGVRSVPVERRVSMAGDARAAAGPGARVIGPESRRARDVYVHENRRRIAPVKDPVHVRRGVQIVVVAAITVDSPFLYMLDMLAEGPGPVRDEGVQRRRVGGVVAPEAVRDPRVDWGCTAAEERIRTGTRNAAGRDE